MVDESPGAFSSADSMAADSLEGTRRVLPRLVLEAGALKPGETAELAIIFEIEDGWHLYWRNPGDSGLPPDVTLILPAGITAGSPRWPAPHRLEEADLILDYTFDHHLVLFYPLEVSGGVPIGDATIRADLSWLVCREMCIPGGRSVTATFPVTYDPVRPFLSLTDRTILDEMRQRLPKEERPPGFTAKWEGESLLLEVPGADGLTFYPYESDQYVYPLDAMDKGEVDAARMILTYPTDVRIVERIAGVLEVRHAGRSTFYEIGVPAPN
jgi:thiol:disulfide interchange protein DsbD